MPGGHASHKGASAKPNTNADGLIDEAADQSLNPDDILPEDVTTNTTRTQEFVDFPPATERPDEQPKAGNEEK